MEKGAGGRERGAANGLEGVTGGRELSEMGSVLSSNTHIQPLTLPNGVASTTNPCEIVSHALR